ncbi:MAG: hypothetical protein ABSB96_02095 [Gaiellaceae bacterium]
MPPRRNWRATGAHEAESGRMFDEYLARADTGARLEQLDED